MAVNNALVIEVDPKIYIMCRLCLEDKGRYQIVPTVQHQIKYCFDINVDHYDGLPPLLCQKCKNLLDEYSAHKKKFIEKQETLINRFKTKRENNLIPKPASIDIVPENNDSKEDDMQQADRISLKTHDKKRNRLVSNSSADSQVSTKTKKKRKNKPKRGWKKNYITYFVCNICSKRYQRRKQVLLHLYNVHSNIKTKYNIILNKIWKVNLNKVDSKLNETKSTNTVMFDHDKIIQNTRNAFYHVLCVSKTTSVKRICSDSSDDDFNASKKRTRVNRPISRSSSNETVLIEGNNNKSIENSDATKSELNLQELNKMCTEKSLTENNDTECINIDDSSDGDIELNTSKSSHHNNAKIENKTIENIISVCKTKYLRKIESTKSTVQSESLLKHKILSIGRKIIKREGQFNCTGFLRYLEHKDLDLSWLPNRLTKSNAESLVRIMTKLKSKNSIENSCDSSGWCLLPDRKNSEDLQLKNDVINKSDGNCDVTAIIISSNTSQLSQSVENQSSSFQSPFSTVQEINNAVIITDNNCEISCHPDSEINSKKLLNKTPVANPKQLPKKNTTHETKLTNADAKNGVDILNSPVFVQVVEEQTQPPTLFMPVITSTTSLANILENKNQESQDANSDTSVAKDIERNVPRIKVKPASELMKPENILKTNDNLNIWPINSVDSITMPNGNMGNYVIPGLTIMPQIQSVQSMQPSQVATVLSVERKSPEISNGTNVTNGTDPIILDTVEIPNTKTYSPFKYFKMLLSIHNITLLEPNAPILSDNSICLLKIKVHFKQENKAKIVVLCLSLFCLREGFRICIKDTNQIDIQMTKISANWQWEILKIFQGDISNKILQNAEKSGQNVYAKTKTFLCLLKSINCKLS